MTSVSQTRVWNVLIDVVAQSGHYKPNAQSLQNDFIAEGEQHYWVHVAIDRFTGEVLDKQIEVVNEWEFFATPRKRLSSILFVCYRCDRANRAICSLGR